MTEFCTVHLAIAPAGQQGEFLPLMPRVPAMSRNLALLVHDSLLSLGEIAIGKRAVLP
jgi:hypothetical protein